MLRNLLEGNEDAADSWASYFETGVGRGIADKFEKWCRKAERYQANFAWCERNEEHSLFEERVAKVQELGRTVAALEAELGELCECSMNELARLRALYEGLKEGEWNTRKSLLPT
jgi:hypothetical protein